MDERAKIETIGFGLKNRHILHYLFQINISVKITVWGCCDTFVCGNLDEKFVSDQSSGLKEMFRRWMRWGLDEISGSLVQLLCCRSFSRHCSASLSAVKVWDIIENRACATFFHGLSIKAADNVWVHFTSKVSRGLDKPSPKLRGQDKPRFELTTG